MLTPLQHVVLDELREHECHWLAKCAEEAWSENRQSFIDDRVRVPRWLRRLFKKANDKATRKEASHDTA